MKLYIQPIGPVKMAFRAIAGLSKCELVETAEEADEVLCMEASEALDVLLLGKRVSLIVLGTDASSAEGLAKNERFKGQLFVFRFSFTDKDGEEMAALISHWQQ